MGDRDPGWTEAIQAAARVEPHAAWRRRLAEATRRATGARFVIVVTCPAGAWCDGLASCDPPEHENLREDLSLAAATATTPTVVAPLEELDLGGDEIHEYRLALRFRGVLGYVVAFLRGPDGALLGSIQLGSELEAAALMGQVRAPLTELATIASATATSALAFAAGFVAPPSDPSRALGFLTDRERQIAELLCQGLSDLNIAARLGISDETVGSHVRKIFRKLAVHSRAELIARVQGLFVA